MILPQYSSSVEREFYPYSRNDSFGLVRNGHSIDDLSSILMNQNLISTFFGLRVGDYHLKELKDYELLDFPPKRFHNNIVIDSWMHSECTTTPIALIYQGNFLEFLKNPLNVKGYVITNFIEGDNLLHVIQNLDSNFLECQLKFGVAKGLKELRERGVFLMDFAPRDLIINERDIYFADFEHVLYNVNFGSKEYQELLEQQKQQFIKDYEVYIPHNKLEEIANCIISD